MSSSIQAIDTSVNHTSFQAPYLHTQQDAWADRRQRLVTWMHMADSARAPDPIMFTLEQIDEVQAHISRRLQDIENEARARIRRSAA